MAFYGYWNYRTGFIGFGHPYDAVAMRVSGFNATCWTNTSEGIRTTDSNGKRTSGHVSRHSDGHASTIWDVDARASGFNVKTAHAIAWIEMRKDQAGCKGKKRGKFWHEPNQGGDGSWSASINRWVLNLNYSGDKGAVLRKSTRLAPTHDDPSQAVQTWNGSLLRRPREVSDR